MNGLQVWPVACAIVLAASAAAGQAAPPAAGPAVARDDVERGWMATARRLLEQDDTVKPFSVAFGGIKPGSGAALGPAVGYAFGDGSFFQGKAEYSIHNYKLAEGRFQSRPLSRGHVVLASRARWQDAPSVALYELGVASTDRRALYGERKTELSAQISAALPARTRLAAGIGYEEYRVGSGRLDTEEDEALTYVPVLPGLGTRDSFVHTFVAGGLDTRPAGDLSRRGARAGAAVHRYVDRSDGGFSFSQVVLEGERLIPIAHERGALRASGTGWISTGSHVPFYLMPWLGGGDFLRGFRTYRFRDRDAVVVSGEVRWRVHEYADVVGFVDAGSVADRMAAFSTAALQTTGGAGIRVHTAKTTIFRMDVARSREGYQLLIGFSPRSSAVF